MSKLQDLIKELCPNGVEFKKLGEVCVIEKGEQLNKTEMFKSGSFPVINGGVNPSGYLEKYNVLGNTITVSQGGASAGFVSWQQNNFWAGAHCYFLTVSDKVINRFIFHFLKSKEYKLKESQYGAGIPALSKDTLGSLIVPVPPLAVQQEIVRILDNFSALTSDLTTDLSSELTLRNKQYEFYRDDLLAPCKDTPVKELKDVLTIKNGSDYKSFEEGPIPVYGSGGIISYINKAVYDKPTVLIPRKGSIDKLYYVDKPFWNVDTIFYTIINTDLVLPKYVYYFLSKFHLERLNTAGGVPSLTQAVLNKIKMPVPSLTVQKRIVDVLDNFEKICHDLKIGIPAEIDARQKQYEFYRDALLTFAETGTILTDRQTDRQTDRK